MTELKNAVSASRAALLGVALFSAVVNVLMLVGPLFMLQIYDRVLSSRSTATLVVLFAITAFLYAIMGLTDHYRGRVLARIGAGFQALLDGRVFETVLKQAEHPALRERPAGASRDLSAIQSMLSSPAAGAAFDLPWTPLFIAVMFMFHPWLGWFSIASAALVLALALVNQFQTKKLQQSAGELALRADQRAETMRQSIETVRGLGMAAALTQEWSEKRAAALSGLMAASDKGGLWSAATKAMRLFLQSAVLGLGAFLVLQGQLTAGAMIAGSILLGRALAPVEQIVGQLPLLQRALSGWKNLSALLAAEPVQAAKLALPRPIARIDVRDLVLLPPGGSSPVLQGVSFAAEPGDAVAIIGPSASGKSSLAKAIVGLWRPVKGEVRLGGAELNQYDRDTLGKHLGYLPQEIALFSGSVAQNIARFDPNATAEQVIDAAIRAGAHDLILALPNGYGCLLTEGGSQLSGGQRQRIALARAFFGDPVALILDEPNASLDEPGVQALNRAIATARDAGKVVLVMSHRPSALAECNKVMIIENGMMRAFGPRDEVLSRFVRPVNSVFSAKKASEAP